MVFSSYHYVYPFMPEFDDADAATVNTETKAIVTDAEDSSQFLGKRRSKVNNANRSSSFHLQARILYPSI